MQKFAKSFRSLPDPRAANALHELVEILVIALAAVLCGATGPTDKALFGRAKEKLLRQFLRLEHGIPSHDTFSRVFRILAPKMFEQTSGASWRRLPRPMGSNSRVWWLSTAMLCAVPTSEEKAAHHCIRSTFLLRKPGWR
jgi:hypothetical protein